MIFLHSDGQKVSDLNLQDKTFYWSSAVFNMKPLLTTTTTLPVTVELRSDAACCPRPVCVCVCMCSHRHQIPRSSYWSWHDDVTHVEVRKDSNRSDRSECGSQSAARHDTTQTDRTKRPRLHHRTRTSTHTAWFCLGLNDLKSETRRETNGKKPTCSWRKRRRMLQEEEDEGGCCSTSPDVELSPPFVTHTETTVV